MNEAGTSSEAPLLGKEAVPTTLAELARTHIVLPTNGGQTAAGYAQLQTEPPPKTMLGEITWLMTQSARHKALGLGDPERLVMPAILTAVSCYP